MTVSIFETIIDAFGVILVDGCDTPSIWLLNSWIYMSPESYEKIWKENFLLSGIHSLV